LEQSLPPANPRRSQLANERRFFSGAPF